MPAYSTVYNGHRHLHAFLLIDMKGIQNVQARRAEGGRHWVAL